MPPPRDAEAAETGGSAEGTDAGVPPPEPEKGEPTVKGAPVVAPSASCLDSMNVEARPSPRPWPVADALEPQEQVPAAGTNVGDGPPPEPWAEPALVSSPRADETVVPASELASEETIVAAMELVAGPSSWPACLVCRLRADRCRLAYRRGRWSEFRTRRIPTLTTRLSSPRVCGPWRNGRSGRFGRRSSC